MIYTKSQYRITVYFEEEKERGTKCHIVPLKAKQFVYLSMKKREFPVEIAPITITGDAHATEPGNGTSVPDGNSALP